jgi:DNA (cytosine-5)-methyltransferase 1
MRDILRACSHPRGTGLKYRLFAILLGESDYNSPESFMVKAERLGLPQARHRLIVTGIREDMKTVLLPLSENGDSVGIEAVLSGLLPIRSGLTHHEDSFEKWIEIISGALNSQWIDEAEIALPGIKDEITKSIEKAQKKVLHAGCDFISCKAGVDWKPGWILDPRIGGVCQHQAKSHMDMDLHRYLFASCVARLRPCSPRLDLFPEDLLPKHKNVRSGKFKDRFRVQREGEPCRTITSHLAADGHAHIHPDPSQCRSLSLREAARVQTFRDNHLLLGNRTQRYTQVGNAVPPYLAYLVACQLAEALGHRPDLIKD